jgi:hypothetical protein
VVARTPGRPLDIRRIRGNDGLRAQHVEEIGHCIRRDVALELRAGKHASDLREELRADDQLAALACPRAENVARRRVALSD